MHPPDSEPKRPVHYKLCSMEIDPETRELRRGSDPIHVQPRVFELLVYLCENAGRAIPRAELIEHLWPNVAVEEGSLNRAVRAARSALRVDPALGDAIQTLRGFGYRLSDEVERQGHSARNDRPGAQTRPEVASRIFVGREPELETFRSAFAAAATGKRQTIILVGEPGIGKTSLASRALEDAADRFAIGRGQCLEGFGRGTPYRPILEALTSLVHECDATLRDPVLDSIRRCAPAWVPFMPSVFDPEDGQTNPLSIQQDQILDQILNAMEQLATITPIALFIEDIHWADPSTLSMLEAIASRPLSARLAILCTARSTEFEGFAALRDFCGAVSRIESGQQLSVQALTHSDLETYLSSFIESHSAEAPLPPRHILPWLIEHTQGHPLFFAEMVEHLHSQGILTGPSSEQNESFDLANRHIGLPETLNQLLGQWVRDLESEEHQLLERAAVCGFEFDTRALAAISRTPNQEIADRCDELVGRGWLDFVGFSSWPDQSVAAQFRFRHAVYADALYEQMKPARRGELHREIALSIAEGAAGDPAYADEVASHFHRGGDLHSATRHRAHAAVFAASRQGTAEVLRHAERGLADLPRLSLPSREKARLEYDLQISQGIVRAQQEGYADPAVEACFQRAHDLAREIEDDEREVAAAWSLAACLQMRGEIERARLVSDRLMSLAESLDEPQYLKNVEMLQSIIAYFQGRFSDCISLGKRALDRVSLSDSAALPALSNQDAEISIGSYMASAYWHRGDPDAGQRILARTLLRARSIEHPFSEAIAEAFASIFYFRIDDREKQLHHARRGIAISEQAEIPLWLGVCQFMEVCALPADEDTLPALRNILGSMAGSGGLGATFFIWLLADRELQLPGGSLENVETLCSIGFATADRTSENNNRSALHLCKALLLYQHAHAEQANDSGWKAELELAREWAQRLGSVAFERMVKDTTRQLEPVHDD